MKIHDNAVGDYIGNISKLGIYAEKKQDKASPTLITLNNLSTD